MEKPVFFPFLFFFFSLSLQKRSQKVTCTGIRLNYKADILTNSILYYNNLYNKSSNVTQNENVEQWLFF
jgi:hypothetical protein